jgi:branched-chain amino acid transport system substrate-binding protein
MNKFFSFLIIILAALINTTAGWASEAFQPSQSVKVALILSETGIAAEDNKIAIRAATLSVEEINKQGGLLGQPVQVIRLDNQSTPIGSKIAAQKALEHDVTAVIGAFWSSHSLPMAEVLQRARVPMITPTSSHPDITLVGNYIFRVCFNDIFQGQAVARFALKNLEAKTAVILKNINEEYSLTLAKYFEKSFTHGGGKVLASYGYKGTAMDFSGWLSEVKKHRPDVVFIPGYALDSGLAVKQAARMGIVTTFLGGDGWDDDSIFQYAGKALEGSYYSTHWHPKVSFPKSRRFLKLYRERYGKDEIIESGNPLTYDAIMVLADAVRRAGSGERQKIQSAIAETKGYEGVTGIITFDKNGDTLNKATIFLKIENGSVTFIKSVSP